MSEQTDYILTVRELQNGYIINEVTAVPMDPMNQNYQDIQLWIEEGGTVTPYDPNYGMTIETALGKKYLEVDNYSKDVIDEAYRQPIAGGPTEDPEKYKYKMNRLTKGISNKLANDKVIPDEDKGAADAFDVLVDYEDEVMDSNDLARDALELLLTVDDILAADITTIVVWPIWTPA